MPAVRRSNTFTLSVCCALAVSLCAFANLRADDYLNKFKAKSEVTAQKTLSDVKGLLEQAYKIRETNPQAAKVLLTNGIALLDNAPSVGEVDRASLRKQLQTRLNDLNTLVREQEVQAALEAKRVSDKAALDTKVKAQSGQGTYNQAKDFYNTGNKLLKTQAENKSKFEQGSNQIAMELSKASIPLTEERITQRFIDSAKRVGNPMTNEEKKLIKALNSVMSVNFNKHPLKEAIEYIQEKAGINIYVDELWLKEKGIEYDSDPVTFKANKVTVRTILKKIFADRGLTFIIKEAAVQAMDPDRAAKMHVTRVYPVQDLIMPVVQNQGPNPYANAAINRAQMYQAVQGLILNIMNSVDPASWQVNGGQGTISFSEVTRSLVIRNSAEFHYQMNGFLR